MTSDALRERPALSTPHTGLTSNASTTPSGKDSSNEDVKSGGADGVTMATSSSRTAPLNPETSDDELSDDVTRRYPNAALLSMGHAKQAESTPASSSTHIAAKVSLSLKSKSRLATVVQQAVQTVKVKAAPSSQVDQCRMGFFEKIVLF